MAAVLTILRASFQPNLGPALSPWAPFTSWSNRIRVPLVALGLPDPIATRIVVDQKIPQVSPIDALIDGIARLRAMHNGCVTAAHILAAIRDDENRPTPERIYRDLAAAVRELSKCLPNASEDRARKSLGGALSRIYKKKLDGGRLILAVDRDHSSGGNGWNVAGGPKDEPAPPSSPTPASS